MAPTDPVRPQLRMGLVTMPLPPVVRRAAARALAGLARDVEDLRLLAEALGLDLTEARRGYDHARRDDDAGRGG